jgi:hypothetical protein
MKLIGLLCLIAFVLVALVPTSSGDLDAWNNGTSATINVGVVNIGTTNVVGALAGKQPVGSYLTAPVANGSLANSAITINGTSVSLGGTRTLSIASSDFANQGTTTTVPHGNAAGNPTWGSVVNADIAASTIDLTAKVTGSLPIANGGTAGTTAATARASLGAVNIAGDAMTGTLTTTGSFFATANLRAGGSSDIYWNNGSGLHCPSDGIIELYNNAGTSFSRLQFGGTTTSFPALKRSTTLLQARLADDSAFTVFTSGGVTDASAGAAGTLGEVISSAVASGSAVTLTNASAWNVTSISLTAGDWDVRGNVNFSASSATVTGTVGGISTTSATLPTDGTEVYSGVQVTLLSETDSVTMPPKQINVSATTTVYLVGKSTFSAGSVTAFGSINARRVR